MHFLYTMAACAAVREVRGDPGTYKAIGSTSRCREHWPQQPSACSGQSLAGALLSGSQRQEQPGSARVFPIESWWSGMSALQLGPHAQ